MLSVSLRMHLTLVGLQSDDRKRVAVRTRRREHARRQNDNRVLSLLAAVVFGDGVKPPVSPVPSDES